MNKFLKGTVASLALVPCLMGLTACKEKEPKMTAENAFDSIKGEINSVVNKMTSISNPNTEFQLNVNLDINYRYIIDSMASMNTEFDAKIRAVIGARNGANKELFGNIGFVDASNKFTSILSAYALDDVDTNADKDLDEAFEPVTGVTETTWNLFKGAVYVLDDGVYVPAGDEFDGTVEAYYMKTTDLMHIYMASNASALKEFTVLTAAPADWADTYTTYYTKEEVYVAKTASAVYEANKYYNASFELLTATEAPADWAEGTYYTKEIRYEQIEEAVEAPTFVANTYYEQTGLDLNELLLMITEGAIGLPDGNIYAVLNIGDELIEVPTTPDQPDQTPDAGMDIDTILQGISEMDFNSFLEAMDADEGVTTEGKKLDNGDVALVLTGDGMTMQFIAKQAGGITIKVDMNQSYEGETTIVGMTLDIDLADEIDETYVPSLEGYEDEEAQDFEEMIMGLLGGIMG